MKLEFVLTLNPFIRLYVQDGLKHQYIICWINKESFLKYDFTKETKICFQLFFKNFLFNLYNLSVNAWFFAPFYFHAVKGVNFFHIAYLFKIRIQLI